MRWPRVVLAACSLATFVAVVGVAAALGPADSRPWLVFSGVLAVAAALQSVTAEPQDLTPALLFSLPPVVALVADGSPTWLIGPFGALLLVGGELNALSWECQGTGPGSRVEPRRLVNVGLLGALGLASALAVGMVGPIGTLGGTTAVVVAAIALAAVGGLVFPQRR